MTVSRLTLRVVSVSLTLVLVAVLANTLRGQTPVAEVGDRIPMNGLAADQAGFALWNTAAGATEAERTGHPTPWTSCAVSAPHYFATRNYADIDDGSNAGLHATDAPQGFPGLAATLAENGFTLSQMSFGWTAQSLGDDMEGTDWAFDETTGVETRHYRGGELVVGLRNDRLVGGRMPPSTVRITYNDLDNCGDDTMTIVTDPMVPADQSSAGSIGTQAVAAALLADLDGNGLTFGFDPVRATDGTFAANGRTGTFFETSSGNAVVSPTCSCPIGIHDGDDTHDWTLTWPDETLPANGPIRLKVVAVTMARAVQSAGMLTVTVFDDRAGRRHDPRRRVPGGARDGERIRRALHPASDDLPVHGAPHRRGPALSFRDDTRPSATRTERPAIVAGPEPGLGDRGRGR